MADTLAASVAALLEDAARSAREPQTRAEVHLLLDRLHGPLRVAIAGKVKAGKSTLLNALLGEGLAATDAGECTQIVTWYRHGDVPMATAHPRDGAAEARPFKRDGMALTIDLGSHRAQDLDHLDVQWPNSRLRDLTLIDTPGLASISSDVSSRTYTALAPDDDRPAVADAVLYLLRHTHPSDIRFLEAFHGDGTTHGTPMNAVGVLSRADEIGSARLDALEVAERVARRYREDVRLRRMCPLVVPVAGLLAFGGSTLSQAEFRALSALAGAPASETDPLLLTADRLAQRPSVVPVTELEREHLLGRLGLYGVRTCVRLLRTSATTTSTALSAQLVALSGLDALRSVLIRQFTQRSQVLKARTALIGLQSVLASGAVADQVGLEMRAEALVAGAHDFSEVRLLAALRSGELPLPPQLGASLERVLGGLGHDPATRLDLPADASPDRVREAATERLAAWSAVASHPLAGRAERLAARAATRTVEGMLAQVT